VIEICTGIADNVDCVSVARPAAFSMLAFQVGILAATLSTSRCSSARRNRESELARELTKPMKMHAKLEKAEKHSRTDRL
jgi:hypothetical protein